MIHSTYHVSYSVVMLFCEIKVRYHIWILYCISDKFCMTGLIIARMSVCLLQWAWFVFQIIYLYCLITNVYAAYKCVYKINHALSSIWQKKMIYNILYMYYCIVRLHCILMHTYNTYYKNLYIDFVLHNLNCR